MDRRAFIVSVASAFLVGPRAGRAQPRVESLRVGILGVTPMAESLREKFLQGLEQGGYTEGRALALEHRHGNGQLEKMPALAAELVRLKVNVIFARGPQALAAARKATSTIPIVAVDLETDPIAMGFAKSLAKPEGNVTGVFLDLPELSGKQIQLFKEIVPGVSRVAVLGDPEMNAAQFRAAEVASRTLGVHLQPLGVRTAKELEGALETARRGRAGAVFLLSSPIVFAALARISALTLEKRLPAVSIFSEFPQAGGLMSYGPSLADSFQRCGAYVGKILAGGKPGDMPIERPQKFELVINLRTAQALGLTVPQLLQLRADRIIQ